MSEPRRNFPLIPPSLEMFGQSSKLDFHIMAFRFLEYCHRNNATVEVGRSEKVEDIADTLRRLNLYSAASSGEKQSQFAQLLSENNISKRFNC